MFASVAVLCCLVALPQDERVAEKPKQETFEYFQQETLPEFRLHLDQASVDSLRENPREYARVTLHEDDRLVRAKLELKLKGAAGSYQEFDERPGFTVRIDKDEEDKRFHGMRKFHLNNSVQDDTYLSEWLGSQFFRSAGYPAPLVRHVHLWVNDRDMGVYVLREGFDAPFLDRAIGESKGDLFDGGFVQDIQEPLELDLGDDGTGEARRESLAEAAMEPDYARRIARIKEELDVDQFIRFMALERMLSHWDGYTYNCNNYRLYFPVRGKAFFLPHGMDQVMVDPWMGVFDQTSILLPRVVMENDEFRSRYVEELRRLAPLFADSDRWDRVIDERAAIIGPGLKSVDPELAERHFESVAQLKARVRERGQNLFQIINEGPPVPVSFIDETTISLEDWHRAYDENRSLAERVRVDDRDVLRLEHKSDSVHSSAWRTNLLLARGRYEFKARVRTVGVVGEPGSEEVGAGLRRNDGERINYLVGTNEWRSMVYAFEVVEDQRYVDLDVELHSSAGRLEVDVDTLKLRRLD